MSKSEFNLFDCLLNHKKWVTGSLNVNQRRSLIKNMVNKGWLTESLQVTNEGHTEYVNSKFF